MKIAKILDADDCIEGGFMKDVYLDEPVQQSLIDHLGARGEVQRLGKTEHFFFRINVDGMWTLSGIKGRNRIKVVLDRSDPAAALDRLVAQIESCQLENR